MGKLLTPEEVCERYNIKRSTLYQWTSKDFIPYIKIGGLNRFREEDLERWEINTVKVALV
ncbi:MAG TPA: DNA-binding protein [Candidatus Omnitrophica bacterium]|nr:DNA-binding protein [Candidatus Omnitrophota bacterium]